MSELTTKERRELQRMIDRTVKHGQAYHAAQSELSEWTRERYGREAGDIDADEIIDGVFGGSGVPSGMAAARYHRIMNGEGHG